MRFMLYNIRYATGRRERRAWRDVLRRTAGHLREIGRYINTMEPDVVGLVEVDAGSYRSSRRNQAEILAAWMGHYHVAGVKYHEGGLFRRLPVLKNQANGFLTRDEIKEARFHYFEHGWKRLAIELELDTVNFFLVHLPLGFRARQYQLSDLYSLVLRSEKPCIVAGDFNVFGGERELRLFLSATGLQSANLDHRATYPSWNPRKELDFICYSPGLELLGCEVPRVLFSDHLPIICDFRLPG